MDAQIINPDIASAPTVDPILFEVIRNALSEATEEMSACLQRTAYSTNIKTRLDYSSAFVDAEGRMVAQAFCQPAHLVTIGRIVPRAIADMGRESTTGRRTSGQ
jgi:N-methylhydantoinase B